VTLTRDTRGERAWCLYDWGNSAFALVCMTAVLPPYLASLVNRELGPPSGTIAWGWISALGLLLGVIVSPLLGALADQRGWRRRLLASFALVGAVVSAALALALPESWRLGAVIYVVAASAFAGANVFYDSLLPGLVHEKRWDELSARGYAYGYAGGALVLLAVAVLAARFGDGGIRAGFVLVGAWWALFTVPVVTVVAEPPAQAGGGVLERLRRSLREARSRPMLWRFLLAYWLYNDGIGTVIKMAAAYGAEVGIPVTDLVGALLFTQLIGIPATVMFGRIGARVGAKSGIQIALAGYLAVGVCGLFLSHAWQFWLLAGLVGIVQGGAQALSRSLYARLLPAGREAEFFSFYDVSGRVAGIAGPALFAIATSASGSGRAGVLVVAVLFLSGALLLGGVEVVGETPGTGAQTPGSVSGRTGR